MVIKLLLAVSETVTNFNTGAGSKAVLLKSVGVTPTENMLNALRKADHTRVKKADHTRVKKADHTRVKKADHTRVKKADHTRVKKADHTRAKKADHTRVKKAARKITEKARLNRILNLNFIIVNSENPPKNPEIRVIGWQKYTPNFGTPPPSSPHIGE